MNEYNPNDRLKIALRHELAEKIFDDTTNLKHYVSNNDKIRVINTLERGLKCIDASLLSQEYEKIVRENISNYIDNQLKVSRRKTTDQILYNNPMVIGVTLLRRLETWVQNIINNELQGIINKSTDRMHDNNSLLVSGFIHEVEQKDSSIVVPKVITNLCLNFRFPKESRDLNDESSGDKNKFANSFSVFLFLLDRLYIENPIPTLIFFVLSFLSIMFLAMGIFEPNLHCRLGFRQYNAIFTIGFSICSLMISYYTIKFFCLLKISHPKTGLFLFYASIVGLATLSGALGGAVVGSVTKNPIKIANFNCATIGAIGAFSISTIIVIAILSVRCFCSGLEICSDPENRDVQPTLMGTILGSPPSL